MDSWCRGSPAVTASPLLLLLRCQPGRVPVPVCRHPSTRAAPCTAHRPHCTDPPIHLPQTRNRLLWCFPMLSITISHISNIWHDFDLAPGSFNFGHILLCCVLTFPPRKIPQLFQFHKQVHAILPIARCLIIMLSFETLQITSRTLLDKSLV